MYTKPNLKLGKVWANHMALGFICWVNNLFEKIQKTYGQYCPHPILKQLYGLIMK